MKRIVIFKDKYNNRLHPRKFYRDYRINTLDKHEYFTFDYIYGECRRVEFIDVNGFIVCEISILNVKGENDT